MEKEISFDKIIINISSTGKKYSNEIKKWASGSKENKKLYHDLLTLYELTGTFPTPFTPDKSKAWQKIQRKIHSNKKRHFLYLRIAQIAAVFIIVFLSVWTGTQINNIKPQSYTEVFTSGGQKTQILLPDKSTVLLNGNSRIIYSQDFNKKNRTVKLEGEGYFKVHKNPSKQFIVCTKSGIDVKVFGTSFNVKSYEDEDITEIGLKTGSIQIDRNNKKIVRLKPGELATFNKKINKIKIQKENIDIVSAWARNEMIFNESSLWKIAKYAERWYGVKINLDPKLQDGEKLTFKVKTESLQELLKMINILKPIKYKIDGKQVTIKKP